MPPPSRTHIHPSSYPLRVKEGEPRPFPQLTLAARGGFYPARHHRADEQRYTTVHQRDSSVSLDSGEEAAGNQGKHANCTEEGSKTLNPRVFLFPPVSVNVDVVFIYAAQSWTRLWGRECEECGERNQRSCWDVNTSAHTPVMMLAARCLFVRLQKLDHLKWEIQKSTW